MRIRKKKRHRNLFMIFQCTEYFLPNALKLNHGKSRESANETYGSHISRILEVLAALLDLELALEAQVRPAKN